MTARRRRRALTLVFILVAAITPSLGGSPAQAALNCETRLAADLADAAAPVPAGAVADACASYRAQGGTDDLFDAFSLVGASVAVDLSGNPISGDCLLYALPTGTNTGIYTLIGVGVAVGAASWTRIVCSADPSGLLLNTLAPGSVAVGVDFTQDPFPPSDTLTRQKVCSYVNAQWILGSGGPADDCRTLG